MTGRESKVVVGSVWGKLTVLKTFRENGVYRVECRCACGVVKTVRKSDVAYGKIKSCGCHNIAYAKSRGDARRALQIPKKLVWVWQAMKQRCNNPNNKGYCNYGGRGIIYDPRWEDVRIFWEDMKEGYSSKLSIERIDNNGNYCKDNCCWADRITQTRNRRSTLRVDEATSIAEWGENNGVSYFAMRSRVQRGMSKEKILTKGKIERSLRYITQEGKTQTVSEWCEQLGLKRVTVYSRIRKGWNDTEVLFGKKE